MRYTKEEKMEVIRLVEGSELSVRRTLDGLGIRHATYYNWYNRFLEDGLEGLQDKKKNTTWNKIPESYKARVIQVALERTIESPRELATYMTDHEGHYISESSVYRILKAADLITSPNHILIKAANEFKDKTTRVHQMWQTDFTYFRVEGRGWFYLSTILDDYSRYIIHHELCESMKVPDVKRSVEAALGKVDLPHYARPKILSDNGPCYVAGEMREYMKSKNIKQVHGAPMHPQTQGKIERYHRSLKNVVKLEHYYNFLDLEAAIDAFVEHYNNHRYHESLQNCTPADVMLGRQEKILKQRQKTKIRSMKQRRMNHLKQIA